MDPDSDAEVPVTTGLLSDARLLDRLVNDTFGSSGQSFTPFDVSLPHGLSHPHGRLQT